MGSLVDVVPWYVVLNDEKAQKKKRELLPDIYFLSSGELLAFNVKLADQLLIEEGKDNVPLYQVRGNMVGKISLIKPGDDDAEG